MTENHPDDGASEPAEPAEVRVCAGCGAVAAPGEGLTWLCSVEDGSRRYFCDTCSRAHLPSIEGRLDSDWW